MAVKKDNNSPTEYSALGMLNTLTDTSPDTALHAGISASVPMTDSGARLPQGRIRVTTGDPELVKKFVSSSNTFDVQEKAPEEKGMNLLMWYMLARTDGVTNNEESGAEFSEGFKSFVKVMGLENTEITYQGQKITLGELSEKLSSTTDMGEDYPRGILSESRLPVGSPVSARTIANAESLAQQRGVLGSIQAASRIVGVDETYMLLKAKQESGFNPSAQARTSSAGGLYQFLDSTWIATANRHKDLLEQHMNIDVDSLSRSQLLALKNNAFASSLMGAAFARDNANYLERNVNVPGFRVDSGALYMAHFLGPAGAEKFYEGLARNPNASAASLFPAAAASNSSVFGGRTLADLDRWADNKMSGPAPVLT